MHHGQPVIVFFCSDECENQRKIDEKKFQKIWALENEEHESRRNLEFFRDGEMYENFARKYVDAGHRGLKFEVFDQGSKNLISSEPHTVSAESQPVYSTRNFLTPRFSVKHHFMRVVFQC